MPTLRFAEAVCPGHPDRLADSIADRIVSFAVARDADALVGIEVALHRDHVFIDGRVASGVGPACAITIADISRLVRQVYADAGYGAEPWCRPAPEDLVITNDLCLGPLGPDERDIRDVSDDQAIAVGHAVWGPRAGHIPVEQALANDFVDRLIALRTGHPALGLGPDGKVLVVVSGRAVKGVSISVHHRPRAEWVALTSAVTRACESVIAEFVAAGELDAAEGIEWLVNGAGAFEIGGPTGDNGLSGKKLVAQAYGSAVPIGGGAVCGKDPHKVDPRGQRLAREQALAIVTSGRAREATVWLAWRPGDVDPHWTETVVVP
jgi:S-adenosylmethionine synthetase